MVKVGIVINIKFGGFCLSDEVVKELQERKNDKDITNYTFGYPRHDSDLVEIVRRDVEKASGGSSKLAIVEIDEELIDLYEIDEYDGAESIRINTKDLCDKLIEFNNIDDMKIFITKVKEFVTDN